MSTNGALSCENLVIGGGIAGVSVAAQLSISTSVILLERETSLAYHTTGRSAAIFLETYGSRAFRQLTSESRGYFLKSLETSSPLVSPRGALFIASESGIRKLRDQYCRVRELTDRVEWLDADGLLKVCPNLTSKWIGGMFEPDAMDIDVHAVHQGFVGSMRANGGIIMTNSPVVGLEKVLDGWRVTTGTEVISCTNVINAAGAWADEVGQLAGVGKLGLQPLKRSAVLVQTTSNSANLPYVADIEESFYFKPSSGGLIVSPCDEIREEPNDTTSDQMEVAIAIDRLEHSTNFSVSKVQARWAGLRTFASDRNPVVGFDPSAEGFFWLAGQGGYGIQSAPALAELAGSLITTGKQPKLMNKTDFNLAEVSPCRFQPATKSLIT